MGGKREKRRERKCDGKSKALESNNWLGHVGTLEKLLKHSRSLKYLFFKVYVCMYKIWLLKGTQLGTHYCYHICRLIIKGIK